MTEKIVLLVILIVGALLTYLSQPISRLVPILKTPEKNNLLIKIIGFIIVLVSVIIAFNKF